MFDSIEKLKRELTDKYVVVDASIPELKRFDGYVGQVKTVNMSGRALVEFDAWSNIGWYDIDADFLRVVPKPEPAAAATKPVAKREPAEKSAVEKPVAKLASTGEKKLSPLEMARIQGAAKAASAQPAGEAAAPPAGVKRSTAEVLAAARDTKPAASTASAAATSPTGVKAATQEAEKTAAPPAHAVATQAKPATIKPAFASGQRPSVGEILAWCREHDAK